MDNLINGLLEDAKENIDLANDCTNAQEREFYHAQMRESAELVRDLAKVNNEKEIELKKMETQLKIKEMELKSNKWDILKTVGGQIAGGLLVTAFTEFVKYRFHVKTLDRINIFDKHSENIPNSYNRKVIQDMLNKK